MKLVRIVSVTNTSTIDFPLHLAAEMVLQRDSRDEIFKAFKLFDEDDTGKISLNKLRRIAR